MQPTTTIPPALTVPTRTYDWLSLRALLASGAFALMAFGCGPEGELPEDLGEDEGAVVAPTSQGFYAMPYEPGTQVKVSRDHLTHSPANRIDMHGVSGGPYRVVAAASGRVRFIEDSHNTSGGSCAGNNYVWIEHPNGEWSKYSHIAQGSARVNAGLTIGEAVKAGQFLGIESDIGCASGDHVHFEVAVPDNVADPIDPVGGYIKGQNRVPKVCGIAGRKYVAGTTYTVPEVRPGWGEYAKHGLPHASFQGVFDAATNCGYQLDWNDGFDRNGGAVFNAVFHPAQQSTLSHRLLTAAELDAKIADYVTGQGYRLVHVDAYNVGSAVRYAAIFKKGAGVVATRTYHARTAAQHQALFDAYVAAGWRPRVISVASVGGVRTYAAIYTLGSIGSWEARSFLTTAEYDSLNASSVAAGRRLIYLNSYVNSGVPRYTAIWASTAKPLVDPFRALTSAQYQTQFTQHVNAGWRTSAVTAFHLNGLTSYGAYWSK